MSDSAREPLVTVVTPSFNKGEFIEETIQSVLNQTYKNIQYIVIDGGSTDDTLSILKRYPIEWVSEPDGGQSDAVNKGWRSARGGILGWINSDDTYTVNAVKLVVDYFNNHPEVGMVHGDAIFTDEKGNHIKNQIAGEFDLNALLSCKDEIPQPSVFIRKEVFESIGGIDTNLKLAMDLEYWIRIGLKYPVGYIPEVLSKIKFYKDAASTKNAIRYVGEYEYIFKKIFSDLSLSADISGKQSLFEQRMYFRYGVDRIIIGDVFRGIIYILRSSVCSIIKI